ncbi:MAG: DUF1289 domain-containing protein [Sphingomonas sp.]|nr:MAG: DUF1289 domain-containing protein [Sphingomonas sp.]
MAELIASAVPSPCRNICRMARGLCIGCNRTLQEIADWPTAPDVERRAILARAKARIRA